MIVSADLSEELIKKLDSLIQAAPMPIRPVRPIRPVWPFLTRTVEVQNLNPIDKKKLEAYQEARSIWEQQTIAFRAVTKKPKSGVRNRSSAVRFILNHYFSNGNSK